MDAYRFAERDRPWAVQHDHERAALAEQVTRALDPSVCDGNGPRHDLVRAMPQANSRTAGIERRNWHLLWLNLTLRRASAHACVRQVRGM
jgi:hypothetical protein